MAYKFQIGAAKMSGSLEQEGNVDIEESGVLKIAGTTVIDASRNVSPALLKMPDVTSGKILVADGTSYQEVAVSGDVSIASSGAVTIADDAVGADQLASNAVVNASIASGAAIDMDKLDGGSLAASLTDLADGDLMYAGDITDSNNLKSITFGNLEDAIFGNVSSDATIAAGGALTIADDAVSLAKMAGLARGKFIVGDSSGNPSALALGTTAQFLVSDNDDAIWRTLSGDATLGADGALTIADDAVGADQLASNAVVNASVASGAAIAYSKMESVATGKVVVGNGSGVGAIVDISGDATLAGTGALTIANDAVITAKILDANVTLAKVQDVAANSLLIRNANSSGVLSELALATTEIMIGDGTGMVAAALSGDVSMSNTGAVSIGATKVTGAMLNNDVISAQTELASDGLAAADEFMISDAGTLKKIGVDNLFKDGPGLLTAAAINVAADHFMFLDNGATGDAKTESIVDLVSAMAGAGLTATNGVLSTDGGSVTDWGVGENRTLSEGFNYRAAAALVSNQDLQLPGAVAPSIGDVVHVKAPASLGEYDLTISCYAAQTVDGYTSIELETGGAAVSMVYIASGSWAIF